MLNDLHTLQVDGKVGTVYKPDGSVQTVVDLNWLSNMLMKGTPLSRSERQVAGLAIKTLLAQQKQHPQGETR
jgi:hypothetical protein